jgi:DNA-binding PadR family transcriptional regulator
MEEKGYLGSEKELVRGKIRRLYRTTPKGEDLLKEAKTKVKELFGEMFENEKGYSESGSTHSWYRPSRAFYRAGHRSDINRKAEKTQLLFHHRPE